MVTEINCEKEEINDEKVTIFTHKFSLSYKKNSLVAFQESLGDAKDWVKACRRANNYVLGKMKFCSDVPLGIDEFRDYFSFFKKKLGLASFEYVPDEKKVK